MALDPKSVEKFMELFRGRTDEFGLRNIETGASWYEGKRDAAGEIMYDEANKRLAPTGLTLEDYQNHLALRGGVALALIPNTRTDNVWFGCLDIDKDDIDHTELVRRITAFGLPLHVFISRSGAAHVYIFFDGDGKPAKLVRKMLEEYALALGCGKDLPIAEIFPNQDEFDEQVLGHHITIPLYGSENSDDRRGKYVSSTGAQWGLEGFLERVEVWPAKRKMPFPVRGESFEMGPPCLETIQKGGGFDSGGRNNGMYNVGVYLKKAYPEDWEERLEAFNRLYLSQPLDKKELVNITKSLKKKDYKYTCQKEPISSHCEKEVCRKRQYGIRSEEEKTADEARRIQLPITKLRKFNTDPPSWEMLVGDESTGVWIKLPTGKVLSYGNLRVSLLEAMNIVPPVMKQKHWEIKLDDLLKFHTEYIDVSEDAGEWPLAIGIVDNLVQNGSKAKAKVRDDVWNQWDVTRMGSYSHTTTIFIRGQLEMFNIKMSVAQVATFMKQTGWNSTVIRMSPTSTLRVWKRWSPGVCPQHQDPKEEGEELRGCEVEDFVAADNESKDA